MDNSISQALRWLLETLAGMLSADAEMLSDGGGVVTAVPMALVGFSRLSSPLHVEVRSVWVNGQPGAVMFDRNTSKAIQTLALRIDEQELVTAVYIVRHPDKLTHLHRSRDASVLKGGFVYALGNIVLGAHSLGAWLYRRLWGRV